VRIGIDLACWANNRGYGRYTRNLVGALVAGDTSHDYVGFADPATLRAGGLPAGLDIVPVAVSEAPTEAAAHDGRRRLVDLWRMTRAAQRATVDVMFFPSSYTYFPVLGPTRTVIVVHDAIAERLPRLIFPNRAGRLAWTLKTRLACWQAQRVVTVSHAAAHSIQHYLPIAPERVRVIYEAADPIFTPPPQGEMNPERRAAVLARFGIRPDARVILYVGGFGPHKNVSTLIDAFARLDNALAMPLQLVLVGQSEGEVFHSEVGALRQQVRQSSPGRVFADNPQRKRNSSKRAQVCDDVAGTTKVRRLFRNLNHGYGRFGRDSPDLPPDEFVQHHVAENKNPLSSEGGDDLIYACLSDCHDAISNFFAAATA